MPRSTATCKGPSGACASGCGSGSDKAVDEVFNRWQSFVVGEEPPAKGEEESGQSHQAPDFRTVALIIAIERVTKATLMRGIWP